MSAQSIGAADQQSAMVSLPQAHSGRYSLSPPRSSNNVNRIVIPALALLALANLPGAMAGPLEYAACVTACGLFATPLAFPGCVTLCLPLIFLPTP